MKRRLFFRLTLILLIISLLSFGCYSYLDKKGPPFYQGPDPRYFENLIDSHADNQEVTYKRAEDFELRIATIDRETGPDPLSPPDKNQILKGELLLRFVWLSDVHIRQREIRLYSNWVSRKLDKFIPTFKFDDTQMDFHWALYVSLIAAINKLHCDLKKEGDQKGIEFMIHTGDSVDTGSMEELYQYLYITNKLEIPWLNLVGNHDVSIFGNLLSRYGYGRGPGVIFYPIGNMGDFIWMHHRHTQEISGFGRYLLPVPPKSHHLPSVEPYLGQNRPETFYHGFDLKNAAGSSGSNSERPRFESFEKAGYYCFDLCEKPIPIRLIALNSTKKDGLGKGISIDSDQRKWFKGNLRIEKGDVNLVFLHHRPKKADGTIALLSDHGNAAVVAFTGDSHEHHLKWHSGMKGGGFYELNSGCLLYFPQIGRIIELRRTQDGRVWIISRALWSKLMTVREHDMPSKDRKEIDKILNKDCRDVDEMRREKIQKNLSEAVRCGNYGGYKDYLRNLGFKWRFWDPAQPFDKVWDEANVIIPVEHR